MRLLRKTKPPIDPVLPDPAVAVGRMSEAPRSSEARIREAPEGMSARVLIAMARTARRQVAEL